MIRTIAVVVAITAAAATTGYAVSGHGTVHGSALASAATPSGPPWPPQTTKS